jgi:hypothetical protein
MSIPGSVLNNQLPFGLGQASSVYPMLATLRPVAETTDSTNQITHTFADSTDPLYTNLACRKSPLIQIRPQDQEHFTSTDERFRQYCQLNFASYIDVPVETLVQWQVKVDGVVYQILSVENDGSKLTTRMMIADIGGFNG